MEAAGMLQWLKVIAYPHRYIQTCCGISLILLVDQYLILAETICVPTG